MYAAYIFTHTYVRVFVYLMNMCLHMVVHMFTRTRAHLCKEQVRTDAGTGTGINALAHSHAHAKTSVSWEEEGEVVVEVFEGATERIFPKPCCIFGVTVVTSISIVCSRTSL